MKIATIHPTANHLLLAAAIIVPFMALAAKIIWNG